MKTTIIILLSLISLSAYCNDTTDLEKYLGCDTLKPPAKRNYDTLFLIEFQKEPWTAKRKVLYTVTVVATFGSGIGAVCCYKKKVGMYTEKTGIGGTIFYGLAFIGCVTLNHAISNKWEFKAKNKEISFCRTF